MSKKSENVYNEGFSKGYDRGIIKGIRSEKDRARWEALAKSGSPWVSEWPILSDKQKDMVETWVRERKIQPEQGRCMPRTGVPYPDDRTDYEKDQYALGWRNSERRIIEDRMKDIQVLQDMVVERDLEIKKLKENNVV